MRLGVLLVLLVGCGGAARAPAPTTPAFAAGAKVRIVDGGQIYDALNTTDCVRWPSPELKRRAGRDAWGGFEPSTGAAGTVVAALAHCDRRTQVVLVEVGEHVVPVTAKGVALDDGAPTDGAIDVEVGLGDGHGTVGSTALILGEHVTIEDGLRAFPPVYQVGGLVDVVDPGLVYDTINQTDCLAWPSADLKKRGGADAWAGYYPAAGERGAVIAVVDHCDGETEIAILEIGGHVVPIGVDGISPAP